MMPGALPFVPDSSGVCVITGLTRLSAPHGANRHVVASRLAASFQEEDSIAAHMSKWRVTALEPASGNRIGFQLVRIRGSFPFVAEPDQLLVSFGDKLVRPTRWDAQEIICNSAPAPKGVSEVQVSVSFDGGSSFTREDVRFAYEDSNLTQLEKPGAHFYHWGALQPRDHPGRAFADERGKALGAEAAARAGWLELKFPRLQQGQTLILGDFVRKYLHRSDVRLANGLLPRCDMDGLRALHTAMGAYNSQEGASGEWTRLAFLGGQAQVLQGVSAALKTLEASGMAVQDAACSERGLLVLLDDGRMVVNVPQDAIHDDGGGLMTAFNRSAYQPAFQGTGFGASDADADAAAAAGGSAAEAARDAGRRRSTYTGLHLRGKIRRVSTLQKGLQSGTGYGRSQALSEQVVMLPPTEPTPEALLAAAAQEADLDELEAQGGWFFGSGTQPKDTDGERAPRVPTFVPYQRVARVAAGAAHFCAVTDDMNGAQLYAWGDNSAGQLGLGPGSSDHVVQPSHIRLGQDEPVKTLACGPYTTICTTLDNVGFSALYSWGASRDSNHRRLNQTLKRSLALGSLDGAFPHGPTSSLPLRCLDFRPRNLDTEPMPNVFWTRSLERWLLAVEQDWNAIKPTIPHYVQVSDEQDRLAHLNELVDVLDMHFRMKQRYIEDLEQTMDLELSGTTEASEEVDIAQVLLEELLASILESMKQLREHQAAVAAEHSTMLFELRATDLAIKSCVDQISMLSASIARTESGGAPQGGGGDFDVKKKEEEEEEGVGAQRPSRARSSLEAVSETVDGEGEEEDDDDEDDEEWERRGPGGEEAAEAPREAEAKGEEETNAPVSPMKQKRRSLLSRLTARRRTSSGTSRRPSRRKSSGDSMPHSPLPIPSEPQQAPPSPSAQHDHASAGISSDDSGEDDEDARRQLARLVHKLPQLEDYRQKIVVEIERNQFLGDSCAEQLYELSTSKKLFSDLLSDWQVESEALPLEDAQTDAMDEFDVILEMLADAQACTVANLAARAVAAEQESSDGPQASAEGGAGGRQAFLFARPKAIVRESMPAGPLSRGKHQLPRGLLDVVRECQLRVQAVAAATEGMAAQPERARAGPERMYERAARHLLEMTQDICVQKQVHFHALLARASETERLLGMGLGTDFAGRDHSEVPSLRRHARGGL